MNIPTSMNTFALKLRRKVGGFITQRTLYMYEDKASKSAHETHDVVRDVD